MNDQPNIADDELIMRRIPERVNSAKARHFKLRKDKGETGLSCNKRSLMLPSQLLIPPASEGSWVASARAKDIRGLGLEVIVVEVPGSPGHCEIVSGTADLDDIEVRDNLASLFARIEDSTPEPDDGSQIGA